MNIRKIIQEEVNDFEWTSQHTPSEESLGTRWVNGERDELIHAIIKTTNHYKGWVIDTSDFELYGHGTTWTNEIISPRFSFQIDIDDDEIQIEAIYDNPFDPFSETIGTVKLPELEKKEDVIKWFSEDLFRIIFNTITQWLDDNSEDISRMDESMCEVQQIIQEEVNDFEWAEQVTILDGLSDREKENPYSMLNVLLRKGYSKNDAMDVVAKYIEAPSKFNHVYDEDVTYWTTGNQSSTFQFKYPPRWNTLTRKFVDWVRLNPGGTKKEFYIEVLGKPYTPGHSAQFFQSIKASGIIETEKGPSGEYTYKIGPNYEAWTKGKLKRYMGMNIPMRLR